MIGRTTSRTDQTVIAHDGLRGGDRYDDLPLRKHQIVLASLFIETLCKSRTEIYMFNKTLFIFFCNWISLLGHQT